MKISFENGLTTEADVNHEWLVCNDNSINSCRKEALVTVRTPGILGRRIPVAKSVARLEKNQGWKDGVRHGIVYTSGYRVPTKDKMIFQVAPFGTQATLSSFFDGYLIPEEVLPGPISIYELESDKDLSELPSADESPSYTYGFICALIATNGGVSGSNLVLHAIPSDDAFTLGDMVTACGIGVASIEPRKIVYTRRVQPTVHNITLFGSTLNAEDFLLPTNLVLDWPEDVFQLLTVKKIA
jgi:hypothetical protein